MNSKFLYFLHRTTFEANVSSFPANLSPLCFIEDSNEIWFNNHFFQAGHDSLRVQEMNNIVSVILSESSFNIIPGSESISIRADGNSIIVSSNALTKIDTDDYLEWREGKLYHKEQEITPGSYGPNVNTSGVNNIESYKMTLDKAGHITNIEQRTQTIRDFVEQRQSDSADKNRYVLLAERETDFDDTSFTMKSKGLKFNNLTQTLTSPKIIVSGEENSNVLVVQNGNVVVSNGFIEGKVKGEVEGTATPKIHLSTIPDYGGASLNTYGHVMLVDEINGIPSRSSDNTNLNNKEVTAYAASPYAVYDYFNNHKMQIRAYNDNNTLQTLGDSWQFGQDFKSNNNTIELAWSEL